MADLERIFRVPVVEAYGMTEASHQIASNPPRPHARKHGSVGPPAGPDVAILGATGDPLPAGVTGEIAIRGASVMTGYVTNAKPSATPFVQGWFRTGDEGYLDQDGYLFITGRLTEQITRGGERIAPREVDEILLLHPAVAQCLTFGFPHPTLGEEVAAAIVLRAGSQATPDEIQKFAAAHVATFKVPRRIVILAQLPCDAMGKPLRRGAAATLGIDVSASFPADSDPTAKNTDFSRRLGRQMAPVRETGLQLSVYSASKPTRVSKTPSGHQVDTGRWYPVQRFWKRACSVCRV
jgi:acyl-CoA synthetase (AMP-forming)/AMP-acid ligase II